MRRVPSSVVTLKSKARTPGISTPELPSTYSPSVFSLKNVQSIPSLSSFTGRTLEKRSNSLRSATFALSIVPPLGVSVGPFKSTSHSLIASSVSGGMETPRRRRFSIVSPSISFSSTLPPSNSFLRSAERTRFASFMRMGPIPSPSISPIFTLSPFVFFEGTFFIFSARAHWLTRSSLNFSTAASIRSIVISPPSCN